MADPVYTILLAVAASLTNSPVVADDAQWCGASLALEEDRDLTQQLRIANRIEPQHARTTSSARVTSKKFLMRVDHEGRGREGDAAHERAALEEQLQFAHRHAD